MPALSKLANLNGLSLKAFCAMQYKRQNYLSSKIISNEIISAKYTELFMQNSREHLKLVK